MGNEKYLRVPTSEQAREYGRRGGLASAEAKKKRKTLAETLRQALQEDAGAGLTKQEWIVAKCLQTLSKREIQPRDLKTIAEVLGELKVNMDISSEGESGLLIKFDDTDSAK